MALGLGMALGVIINLLAQVEIMPELNGLLDQFLTGVAIGGGGSFLHDLVNIGQTKN